MQTIKKTVAEKILAAVHEVAAEAELTAEEIAAMLEYPPDADMGDLAFPCFRLSKTLRRSPVQIAASLCERVNGGCIEKVEAVGGYLNLTIANSYLGSVVVPEILEKGDRYGAQTFGVGKRVVLDYSSPNVAKPFHIGHLGTTVIGHALRRLHEFAGYSCYGINYLGDWGTQFGKLIVAYRLWGSREMVEKEGIDKLVELYVKINNAIKGDPENGVPANQELADASRAEFRKLEEGDEENLELWRWFVQISLAEYEKTYRQLGIEFDSYKGESFYTDKMPAQIQKLRDLDMLKLDDGASIVDLSDYNMPPCLILKRDGSTLYPTRDIAAAVYRKENYHFDKMIYVTSAQQCLHFAQWFKVVELMGYPWYNELVHVPYGTVSLNGAKLATRTGNVVLLRDLFDLAIEKVKGIMQEKNPDLENSEEIAEAVGVGAIVFYYLTNNRMKDINFVMEEALSFDGNTGPYVQYTYARACSLLSRGGSAVGGETKVTCEEEATLVKLLCRFGERVCAAIADYEPSYITRYILEIASAFNRFYHNCPILSAEDEETRRSRLNLTAAVKVVLGNAFDLICLKKTEKV
ncbi:MAG: arginine--tRNA ligase [Ruminococcaceae bacterium]|nr:arginine--tRNA ligase [Oscillospiraceae bacterium]